MFMTRRWRELIVLKALRRVVLVDKIRKVPYHSRFGAVITEVPSIPQQHSNSPIVVILGWNDSKGKHLQKYGKIFEKRNFDSICIPANSFNTFFRSGTKVKKISLHILDLLLELKCEERPVFLYAFSNGGCALFFHLMEALSYPKQPFYKAVPVVGTIFDSCPISPDINNVNATIESVSDTVNNPVLRGIIWCCMRVFIPPVIYFNDTVKRFMSALKESPLKCPQLVLYSKTDKFAPYQDIDSYVEARRKRGVNIVSKCWDSSEHVNHYREHTNEYLDAVNIFVDQCLDVFDLKRK